MSIADVLKAFRQLKDDGSVRDYLVFGSVAAMAHTRPFFTRDVDIGVAVESDAEFIEVFRRLASFGEVRGHAVVINDTPAEVFPVDISPIIQDALVHARRKRVEGMMVKVAPPEHLLLEALRVFRNQDKARVFLLDEVADRKKLRSLLGRLDSEGVLKQRYRGLTGKAP
jgi:hypothetical protein